MSLKPSTHTLSTKLKALRGFQSKTSGRINRKGLADNYRNARKRYGHAKLRTMIKAGTYY